jgi:hypothetical protein
MVQAKKMLMKGIITSADFIKIDSVVAEKYGIPTNSIYRGMDMIYNLIYIRFNGNMSNYEEVKECREP